MRVDVVDPYAIGVADRSACFVDEDLIVGMKPNEDRVGGVWVDEALLKRRALPGADHKAPDGADVEAEDGAAEGGAEGCRQAVGGEPHPDADDGRHDHRTGKTAQQAASRGVGRDTLGVGLMRSFSILRVPEHEHRCVGVLCGRAFEIECDRSGGLGVVGEHHQVVAT